MSKHIHIHMHPVARTADAFNEADHPRDGGKFTSGSKVNHPGSNQPGTYHGPVSAAHSKASGHKEPHSWVTNSYGTKQMHPTASLSKHKPAGYLPGFKPPTKDAGWNESDHSRSDNGQFGAGGSGHVLSRHSNNAEARAEMNKRRKGLEVAGFKHKRTVGNPDESQGQRLHFVHPDGSRAVLTHSWPTSGRHLVNSRIQHDEPVGANAHKLIDPGTAALMNSGQRALSGLPNK